MKRLLSLTLIFTILAQVAWAQFPYKSVTARKEAYQPLTNGTSISSGVYWQGDNYGGQPFRRGFKLPFNVNFGTTPADTMFIINGMKIATDTFGIIPAFIILNANLVDKGFKDKVAPMSPIRYETTGTSPNRIFKLEITNAGFGEEFYMFGSMKDSVNIQMWFYEEKQIVEYHYGPSSVQGNDPYPFTGLINMELGNPTAGYIEEWEHDANDWTTAYMVSGDPEKPYLDSLSNTGGYVGSGLNSFPVNGQVICFGCDTTKNPNAIASVVAKKDFYVYPTMCKNEVYVNNTSADAVNYDVVAMSGAIINYAGTLQLGKTRIDISALAAGTYAIRLQNKEGLNVYRFIKQ